MSDRVILSDQPSRSRATVLWPLAALVIGAPFLLIASGTPGAGAGPAIILAMAVVIAADVALVLDLRSRGSTVYMLTPKQIIRVFGTRNRVQQAVPLESIQSVTVQQSIFGRLLNYGTVVIEAGAVGRARLVNVPRPREWEKAILQAMPHPPTAPAAG